MPANLEHPSLERHRATLGTIADIAQERGRRVWIVGGSVRDMVLGLPVEDLDLVTPQAGFQGFLKALARGLDAAIVPLDPAFPTFRLVPRDGRPHVDLNGQQGPTLETDLRRRDFALNAMALEVGALGKGTATIDDPFDGLGDLERHTVSAVADDVFVDDPLRLLRGPRMCAKFGLTIAESTVALIKRDRELLPRVSRERVLEEITKICETDRVASTWEMLAAWGLLAPTLGLPEVAATDVGPFLASLEGLLRREDLAPFATDAVAQGYHFRTDLFLGLLFSLQHGILDANLGGREMVRFLVDDLKCSTKDALLTIDVFSRGGDLPGDPAVFFWIYGDRGPLRVRVLEALERLSGAEATALLQAWSQSFGDRVLRGQVVQGRDLIRDLGLTPGPEIGRLVKELHWRFIRGDLATRDEGLAVARTLVDGGEFTAPEAAFGGVKLLRPSLTGP